jgi:hypothetical protein
MSTFIVWHKTSTINNRMLMGGEIIGILASGESGLSCESHEVCGEYVAVGDLVKFKLVVIDVDGEEEEAIKI